MSSEVTTIATQRARVNDRITTIPDSQITGTIKSSHFTFSLSSPYDVREVITMPRKELVDKLSIYIPQSKLDQKPVERRLALGEKRDRSVNYLVVQAIIEYLDREEKK